MPRDRDTKQVDDIANQYHMTEDERREFGDYIEDLKHEGFRGSKNDRGDFTYILLIQNFVN
jgi:hypothetical protein